MNTKRNIELLQSVIELTATDDVIASLDAARTANSQIGEVNGQLRMCLEGQGGGFRRWLYSDLYACPAREKAAGKRQVVRETTRAIGLVSP